MSKYDKLSFKDAFNKAYDELGEGKTFTYKGKEILLKKAESKKDASKSKKNHSIYKDISFSNPRIKELTDMGLDLQAAYAIHDAEQSTGKSARITSAYRDLDDERRVWEQMFNRYVANRGFSPEVEEAIRIGNSMSRSDDTLAQATDRVISAGGDANAIQALTDFRANKAPIGLSKHTLTRSSFDIARDKGIKDLKKYLESNKNYKEFPEYIGKGKNRKKRTDIYHLDRLEIPDLGTADLRKMDDSAPEQPPITELFKKYAAMKPDLTSEDMNPEVEPDLEVAPTPSPEFAKTLKHYTEMTPEEKFQKAVQDQGLNEIEAAQLRAGMRFADGGYVPTNNEVSMDDPNNYVMQDGSDPEELLRRLEEERLAQESQDIPTLEEMNYEPEMTEIPVAQEQAPQINSEPTPEPPKAPEFDVRQKYIDLYNKLSEAKKEPSEEEMTKAKWIDAISNIGAGLNRRQGINMAGGTAVKDLLDKQNLESTKGLENLKSKLDILKALNPSAKSQTNPWKLSTLENEEGIPTTYRVNTLTGEKEALGTKGYSERLIKDPITGEYIDVRERIRGKEAKRDSSKVGKGTFGNLTPNQRDDVKEFRKDFKKETEDIRASYDKINGLTTEQIDLAIKNPVAAGQLGAQVATIFENGRLTDEDVVRYTRRSGLSDKTADTLRDLKNGTISNAKAAEIKESLKVFEKVLERQINKRALENASYMEEMYGIPAEDIVKAIYPKHKFTFTRQEEAGIKKVMDKNKISREKAISALIRAGKL